MAVSAIKQMQETGDIDSNLVGEAIESAIPQIPKASGVCFVSEENALAFNITEKYVIVLIGGRREWFLCHVFFCTESYEKVLPDGPYQFLGWDELYDAWDMVKSGADRSKFIRSMREAVKRINERCSKKFQYEFSLFSYDKNGIRLHVTRR